MKYLITNIIILCSIAHASEKNFTPHIFATNKGQSLNYRIHIPENPDPNKKYPLILFLHGAGERGNDNTKQLKHGAKQLLDYSIKSNNPAIIIAPQCPKNQQWVNTPWSAPSHTMPAQPSTPMQLTIQLLQDQIKNLPVDPQRIYITGISMGGFATWDLIQRHPSLFAAAIPICGGGDTAKAGKLTHLPIWAFHGDKDTTVLTSRSRDMITAIKKADGTPTYTEYPGVAHNSWTRTYKNQQVLKWLFSQKKNH